MEAFAESAIKLERVMKRPHDWENEEDLEGQFYWLWLE